MKKNWRRSPIPAGPTIKTTRSAWVAVVLLAAPAVWAKADLDKQYSLDSIGFLKSTDNMDGLFSEYVQQAYREAFAHQSRFRVQDLGKADALLSKSKIPYAKLVLDPKILRQLAQSMKVDTLIRTHIGKEGPRYRVSLEWIKTTIPITQLADETFVIDERPQEAAGATGAQSGLKSEDIQSELQKGVLRLVDHVPFKGTVSGRDGDTVTANLGGDAGIKPGDTLIVGTLDEVRLHPLLHAVVDWRLTQTGRLQVETVDESLSFSRVTSEEPGRKVARQQKIMQVIPAVEVQPSAADALTTSPQGRPKTPSSEESEMPKLGWGSGGIWLGSYHREFSSQGTAASNGGGGFLVGVKTDNQLWLTPEWFTELGVGAGYSNFSQKNLVTNSTSGSGDSASVFNLRFDVGYTYLPAGNIFGPKGWIRFGYRVTNYSLPISAANLTGPASFKGLFIGVGGELPIRAQYGLALNLDFGLLPSTSVPAYFNGASDSVTDVSFFVGAYYRYSSRMTVRAGFDVMAQSATYLNGGALTERVVAFGPSLLYYF